MMPRIQYSDPVMINDLKRELAELRAENARLIAENARLRRQQVSNK